MSIEKRKLAYSIPEAAEAIGQSTDTIRRSIARGDLSVKYPNSKPVILASELESWLDSLPSEAP
ncbi:helix-turn-helix transcriptional regulator [Arthrobacter woluwensis]|uniref:Helix-turn-helix domain-containing protein n=1 Tax=Arthrobacter woluwensis TaxID=156980 RepID=A0A1H4WU43_9MICC|nr:helix-turn-helix domain-containing protein [Arthrobacter woluwensis]SEC89311.1 hypothetical protein SAMN04489745_3442 [Arthrobacter woluwensis]SEC96238.1 hypothetical protein SAMN04489745_3562 [Arthrobacter woluwensis]